MQTESLRYFLYIAKYKNITSAAKHLYVSQSTLSRQIMSLENELGVTLFYRDNKKVSLTKAGETLYKESASFIDHMDAMIKNVQAVEQGMSGVIRITLPNHLAYILDEPLKIMKRQYPDIHLVVESYFFNEVPSAIAYNLYNIGATYDFSVLDQMELITFPVGSDDFSLVVPYNYLRETSEETLSAIVNELHFYSPAHNDPPFLPKLLAMLQEYSKYPTLNAYEVNNTESMLLNISLGLGYGFVPTKLAKSVSDGKNMATLSLPELESQCNIVIAYKKSETNTPTQKFVEIVTQCSENSLLV